VTIQEIVPKIAGLSRVHREIPRQRDQHGHCDDEDAQQHEAARQRSRHEEVGGVTNADDRDSLESFRQNRQAEGTPGQDRIPDRASRIPASPQQTDRHIRKWHDRDVVHGRLREQKRKQHRRVAAGGDPADRPT
jgi:hypothetical protein